MDSVKVYYYTDAEAGVHWPGPDADFLLPDGRKKYDVPHPRFVWYELPGFEKTDNPASADVFCLRQRLIWLSTQQIYSLPYLRGNERKHLFFDLGSDSEPACFRDFPDIPAIFLRAVCDKPMLAKNPTTLTWPWPVDDLGEYMNRPFQYDVVFQGQVIQGGEGVLLKSVQEAGLNVHIKKNNSFYGNMQWGTPEKQALRVEFAETMAGARLSLCHRSNPRGVMRYRFYEAMSMGRVPVLFGDDCILPFADRIDYSRCSLWLKESDAPNAGTILKDWISKHCDDEIIEMGKYGRAAWESWLKRERWNVIVEQVVRERLTL
jgi:hypothetical protein